MHRNDQTHGNAKWDPFFLGMADYISTISKDPSTKVGAVLVDDARRVIGLGYNGFPRGISDHPDRYAKRELKYEMIVHAEANAILNAIKSTHGATLYCNFFPCPRCAALLIQAGIRRIISRKHASDDRWKESHEISRRMFQETGIQYGSI